MQVQRKSRSPSAIQAEKFIQGLKSAASGNENKNAFLDSVAAANEAIDESITGASQLKIPGKFAALMDELGDSKKVVVSALLDSVSDYESRHGHSPSADLIEQALHLAGMQTQEGIMETYGNFGLKIKSASEALLDDATSTSADPLSLQANRAVVSIMTTFGTAIPWALNLPVDLGSGEAKIIIVNDVAGSKFGRYNVGDVMNGSASGRSYMMPDRFDKITIATGAGTAQFSSVQADNENCAAVAGDVVAVKLLKGRTTLMYKGRAVATEVTNDTATSTLSGTLKLSGVTYAISGTVNVDTGAVTVDSNPDLPDGTELIARGLVDYARQSSVIPSFDLSVVPYKLYAVNVKSTAKIIVESLTQIANEAGLDPTSQLMGALQRQRMNENHRRALIFGHWLAVDNIETYDASVWLATGAQTRAQTIENITIPLGAASQKMAIDTNSYGIGTVYCGAKMKQWLHLLVGNGRFVPSGIRTNPNIHYIGRLDDTYDFYYDPDAVETTDGNGVTTAEMLGVGASADVARSPFVTGMAVSPILLPSGRTPELTEGFGYYEKMFGEVNPHEPSSKGFAKIIITGLK